MHVCVCCKREGGKGGRGEGEGLMVTVDGSDERKVSLHQFTYQYKFRSLSNTLIYIRYNFQLQGQNRMIYRPGCMLGGRRLNC